MARNSDEESYSIKRIESVLSQDIIPQYKILVNNVNDLVDDLQKLEQAIHGNSVDNPNNGLTGKYCKMRYNIEDLWRVLKESYLPTLSAIYDSAVLMASDVNKGDFDNMLSSFASSVAGTAIQASLNSLKNLPTKSFKIHKFDKFSVKFLAASNGLDNIGKDLLSIDSCVRDIAVVNSSLKNCFTNSSYSEDIDKIDNSLQSFMKRFSKIVDNFKVVAKKKINWYTEHVSMSEAKLKNYKIFLNDMEKNVARYSTQGVVPTAAGIATGSYATLSKDADGNEIINSGVSMSAPYKSTGGITYGSALTNEKSPEGLNSYDDVVKAQKALNKKNGSDGKTDVSPKVENPPKGEGDGYVNFTDDTNNLSVEASYQMKKKAAWENGKIAEQNARNAAAVENTKSGEERRLANNNPSLSEQAARNAAAERNTEIGKARLNIELARNNTANAKAGEQAAQAAKIAAERNNTSINNSKYSVSDTYMQAVEAYKRRT